MHLGARMYQIRISPKIITYNSILYYINLEVDIHSTQCKTYDKKINLVNFNLLVRP
jgi:hypothetical protein